MDAHSASTDIHHQRNSSTLLLEDDSELGLQLFCHLDISMTVEYCAFQWLKLTTIDSLVPLVVLLVVTCGSS